LLRVRERKTLMNDWLKKGAFALVLGAFCTLSGAALAVPKPGILTPPTKATTASAKSKPGEPIAKIEPAASAAPSAGAAPTSADDEKAKEAFVAKRKEWKEKRKATIKDVRAEVKKQVEAALKGKPMEAGMKEELKRHAQRTARLERAKSVADEAKDADTVARVDKLIEKENARHDKWLAGYAAKAMMGDKDKAGAK
jgi:hypothetical protein